MRPSKDTPFSSRLNAGHPRIILAADTPRFHIDSIPDKEN
jgi:hypothetical protein